MRIKTREAALLLISLSAPAYAQTTSNEGAKAPAVASSGANAPADAASSSIEEIIVTAQRRSEPLQKVPVAVTALTGESLAERGITDVPGIVSSVPNLNLGEDLGAARVTLRGVGLENTAAASEGSIALYENGVFASRPINVLASFYDVDQVEVLRGPQGTLYGRNATGGSINIMTREPTQELSGYFNLTGGNYGRVDSAGAVSGAIVPDVLAVRLAFQTQNHDGYGTNIDTGDDIDNLNTRAVRGTLVFTPNDRLTVDIKGDYFNERDNSGGFHTTGGAGFSAPGVPVVPYGIAEGGTVPTNIRDINSEEDPLNRLTFWGVQGKISYSLSDNVEISSLTAYRSTQSYLRTDIDFTNIDLVRQFFGEDAKQISEELQLSGKSDRISWLLGLYYFHENDIAFVADPLNPARTLFFGPDYLTTGFLAGGSLGTNAGAGFGQATYNLTSRLHLTFGARYSIEEKIDHDESAFNLSTPFVGAYATPTTVLDRSKTWDKFTPRVAVDYQIAPNILLYGSWSEGFKSGTYSLGAGTPPVNPETVSAFEAGLKSKLFDERLQYNLAGFYYDYKDLQVGKVVDATLELENAATATIYGLEAEFQAKLTSALQIDGNAAWLHARFDNYISADPTRPFGDGHTLDNGAPAFNLSGNTLSQSPNFAVLVGAQYKLPSEVGPFTLRGEVAWKSRVYFTPFNLKYISQAPEARENLFLNWVSPRDGGWTASLFVKNVTNKLVVASMKPGSTVVGSPLNGYLEDPRTYGVTVGYKF